MRLAVLIASFNRVAITLRGLDALQAQLGQVPDLDVEIFLTDDASPDGTALAVAQRFPAIHLVQGTGDLFWNGGMCASYRAARAHGQFDAYLLFNDDVLLHPDKAARFFADFRALEKAGPAILVGPMEDHADGPVVYSGYRRGSRWRPMIMEKLMPDGEIQRCDTLNGNFVLISGPYFESADGLDPRYVHQYGDLDLGYRARRDGVQVAIWREAIGICRQGPAAHARPPATFREAWERNFTGRASFGQHAYFLHKHSPWWAAPPLIALSLGKRLLATMRMASRRVRT